MTIEELYGKVMADEALKAELAEAAAAHTVAEWAAAQGVEATEEELFAYARAAVQEQELTDEQLEQVAGGWGYGTFIVSTFTLSFGCEGNHIAH